MIGAIGDQPAAYKERYPREAGRCGEAVGQQAKAPVTAAREGGAEKRAGAIGCMDCAGWDGRCTCLGEPYGSDCLASANWC